MVICFAVSQFSCYQQQTCNATVTVVDSTNKGVNGALVRLYPNVTNKPSGEIQGQGTTNSAGVVTFNFQLPAIFQVYATKPIGGADTLKGTGVLQLQVGNTATCTVTVR